MKINKVILTTALSLGAAGLSYADTVYVTGSTADRSAAYAAFIAPGVVFSNAPTITVFNGSANAKANWMVFQGDIVGGPVGAVVSCHWSGSDAGITDVGKSPQVPGTFVNPSLYGSSNLGADPASTESHTVDLAFADNEFDESQIYGNNATPPPDLTGGQEIGVITFKWLRNPGLFTGANVTSAQIRQALGGLCPRSLFTGVAGQTDRVYVSGRDNGSGTRVNAYGDSGFGIFNIPNQVEIDASGNMQSVGGLFKGDFGFSSGGTLAGTMGGDTTTKRDFARAGVHNGFSVLGYMSQSDAVTALTAGATELTYNGVPFSVGNIEEGTYTFWGNEWLFPKNGAGTTATEVFSDLVAGIASQYDGVNAIPFTSMNASRANAHSDVSHN